MSISSLFSKTKDHEDFWKNQQINNAILDHPHRKFILQVLREHPVKSVLEVGCGIGANLFLIKKEFPEVKVAGCDINEGAIRIAKEIFEKEFPGKYYSTIEKDYEEHPYRKLQKETAGGVLYRDIPLPEFEFRVGAADAIPFNGDSFDLVITDAAMIYISKDKITRVLREIRRVGYNKYIFVELHTKSKIMQLRTKLKGWESRDYEKALLDNNFKFINFYKISKELWPQPLWYNLGYYITCIR